LVAGVAGLTSALPRIKGVGMLLALVARCFRGWDVEVEKRVFGSRMRLRNVDYLSHIMLFTPDYFDREERALVSRIVRPGDTAVDVGANIGIYTLLLARLVGDGGRIIAVEAEAANGARLRTNVGLNSYHWVDVIACGASDKAETLALNLDSTGNAGGHSFIADAQVRQGVQTVKCARLADLLDLDAAPRFMKLDIEGFEYRVLNAYFEDVPMAKRPDYIMLEDVPGLREGDAVALVLASGYELIRRIDYNAFLKKNGAP
jgi:FkbM family methyltransferase